MKYTAEQEKIISELVAKGVAREDIEKAIEVVAKRIVKLLEEQLIEWIEATRVEGGLLHGGGVVGVQPKAFWSNVQLGEVYDPEGKSR